LYSIGFTANLSLAFGNTNDYSVFLYNDHQSIKDGLVTILVQFD